MLILLCILTAIAVTASLLLGAGITISMITGSSLIDDDEPEYHDI